jgi:ABC-type transport system involved in multi-copper enzyme maturation permease subunit
MDAVTAKPIRVKRLLPYWAVFQADLKLTLRSWVYRAWVLLSLGSAIGYILYRYGVEQVAGMEQQASDVMIHLLRWVVLGSVTLIVVLTAGTISSELGTMADSVLSRGISRFQYFLGKWHARLVAILGTFFLMGLITLVGSFCMLHGEHLSLAGTLVALVAISAILMVVITCSVTVSSLTNTTLVSMAVGWMAINGGAFALSLLPASYPTPDRILSSLPHIIHGAYNLQSVNRLLLGSLVLSIVTALVGMVSFSRRDV